MGLKGTGETTTYLPGECVESAAASVVAPDVRDVCCWWVWMVVRFVCPVCVVRVPLCARVSRVCPVCVPAPPGVFLPGECVPAPPGVFLPCITAPRKGSCVLVQYRVFTPCGVPAERK